MVSSGREGRVGALAGDIVLCCAVLCCAVLCCAVLCYAVRCGAVLCCVVGQDTLLSQYLSTPRCNNNKGLY